jgi:hypothetical protein
MARGKGLAWSVGLGAALFAIFRAGFANWDTAYALVWGNEVLAGRRPDFDGVALTPTNHPLADLVGIPLAALGDAGETLVVVIAFLALGAVGYLVYRLATTWFGPLAGVVAAVLVLTRAPVLSFGARAYVDLPYVALVLGALALELRRPRSGAPVLALLALAGLLRPEAWLFSGAYLVWIAYVPGERRLSLRRAVRLLPIALAAPVGWALFDLVSTGDALASLTGTRSNVDALGRATGVDGLFSAGPRRLGEVVREPGLLAAALGAGLGLLWLRARTVVALAATALAFAALAVLALAGLPIVTRYFLLAGALLCTLAGAGLGGWRLAPRGTPHRVWLGAAVVALAVLLAFAPSQARRLRDVRDSVVAQDRIEDDLHELADAGAFPAGCEPVALPSSHPVPLLALWLDRAPDAFVTPGDGPQPRRGVVLLPANARVASDFELDPRDPGNSRLRLPAGFDLQGANRSWRVYARC